MPGLPPALLSPALEGSEFVTVDGLVVGDPYDVQVAFNPYFVNPTVFAFVAAEPTVLAWVVTPLAPGQWVRAVQGGLASPPVRVEPFTDLFPDLVPRLPRWVQRDAAVVEVRGVPPGFVVEVKQPDLPFLDRLKGSGIAMADGVARVEVSGLVLGLSITAVVQPHRPSKRPPSSQARPGMVVATPPVAHAYYTAPQIDHPLAPGSNYTHTTGEPYVMVSGATPGETVTVEYRQARGGPVTVLLGPADVGADGVAWVPVAQHLPYASDATVTAVGPSGPGVPAKVLRVHEAPVETPPWRCEPLARDPWLYLAGAFPPGAQVTVEVSDGPTLDAFGNIAVTRSYGPRPAPLDGRIAMPSGPLDQLNARDQVRITWTADGFAGEGEWAEVRTPPYAIGQPLVLPTVVGTDADGTSSVPGVPDCGAAIRVARVAPGFEVMAYQDGSWVGRGVGEEGHGAPIEVLTLTLGSEVTAEARLGQGLMRSDPVPVVSVGTHQPRLLSPVVIGDRRVRVSGVTPGSRVELLDDQGNLVADTVVAESLVTVPCLPLPARAVELAATLCDVEELSDAVRPLVPLSTGTVKEIVEQPFLFGDVATPVGDVPVAGQYYGPPVDQDVRYGPYVVFLHGQPEIGGLIPGKINLRRCCQGVATPRLASSRSTAKHPNSTRNVRPTTRCPRWRSPPTRSAPNGPATWASSTSREHLRGGGFTRSAFASTAAARSPSTPPP